MSISDKKLSLDGNAKLLENLTGDFYIMAKNNAKEVPKKRVYVISCEDEPNAIKRAARKAFFESVKRPIKKLAFDTRRIDQVETRNPRQNLQNWHRSDAFIDDNLQAKISTFSHLNEALNVIEDTYGGESDYINSYAKELHNHVKRGLRIGVDDQDYFLPQFDYLEQLLYTRYRLAMSDIVSMDKASLKKAILTKDENLLKRGNPISKKQRKSNIGKSSANTTTEQLASVGNKPVSPTPIATPAPVSNPIPTSVYATPTFAPSPSLASNGNPGNIIINNNVDQGSGNQGQQENIINALFGGGNLKTGDKSVSRTVTITITDEVND